MSTVESEALKLQIYYNDFAKIERVDVYDGWYFQEILQINEYNRNGGLVEKRRPNYDEGGFWRETFFYEKGELKNGTYRQVEGNVNIWGYKYHEVVEGEEGVLEYSVVFSDENKDPYTVKRSFSGGNMDWEERTYEKPFGQVIHRDEYEYDEFSNPYYQIGFFSPFNPYNSNRNNVTKATVTNEFGNQEVHRFTYRYKDGYPEVMQDDKLIIYQEQDTVVSRVAVNYYHYQNY